MQREVSLSFVALIALIAAPIVFLGFVMSWWVVAMILAPFILGFLYWGLAFTALKQPARNS